MNHKPFLAAIGAIIALAAVWIVAAGPKPPARPERRGSWTLTFSLSASNRTVASPAKR